MLELITYLIDSEFKVYIVSGSEEGLIWGRHKRNFTFRKRPFDWVAFNVSTRL